MSNRIIKESIRTSKTVNAMSDFQFRLWVYLITYVDDFGRGSADPELLKGFVFPRRKRISESDLEKTLAELAGMGCIHLYQADGESYFCFPNWSEHQRIQNKRSKFPEPPASDPPAGFNMVHSASPYQTAGCGDPPPESNPIQAELNPESQSKSQSESEAGDAFALFWAAYPRKAGKADALKAFKKVHVPAAVLLSAIEAQKRSRQWTRENGQYIPNPATWLNQERWEDELSGQAGFQYNDTCGKGESL